MKDLEPLRFFNTSRIKSFLASNQMPDNIKMSKSRNKITSWFTGKKFGEKDIVKVCEMYGGYYNVDQEDILLNEMRDFIYLLYKHRKWKFREFYKQKYSQIKIMAPNCGLLGRHTLIAAFNAAMCDRGFSEQNQFITKRRTCVGTPLLRNCMIINLEGPKWNEQTKLMNLMIRSVTRFGEMSNYDE